MSLWKDYRWSSADALNGFLIALLFPLPFLYASARLVSECPEASFLFWDGLTSHNMFSVCGAGTNFGLLVLVLLYVPMYLLALAQGNGWLNDLYWTLVPLLALFHYTLVGLRFYPFLDAFRLGLLWGTLLVWSVRLTHNYLRREEWTWGAREDFRFVTMRKSFGWHWVYVSFFAQFVSQHVTEVLFSIPYFFILRDAAGVDWFDYCCAGAAILFVFGAWLADNQLREFVSNEKNRTQVLQTGLWAWSRHPNYLCESSFHWCFGIWALRTCPSCYWILLCPFFNTLVLLVTTYLTEANFLRGVRRQAYTEYCTKVRMFL